MSGGGGGGEVNYQKLELTSLTTAKINYSSGTASGGTVLPYETSGWTTFDYVGDVHRASQGGKGARLLGRNADGVVVWNALPASRSLGDGGGGGGALGDRMNISGSLQSPVPRVVSLMDDVLRAEYTWTPAARRGADGVRRAPARWVPYPSSVIADSRITSGGGGSSFGPADGVNGGPGLDLVDMGFGMVTLGKGGNGYLANYSASIDTGADTGLPTTEAEWSVSMMRNPGRGESAAPVYDDDATVGSYRTAFPSSGSVPKDGQYGPLWRRRGFGAVIFKYLTPSESDKFVKR